MSGIVKSGYKLKGLEISSFWRESLNEPSSNPRWPLKIGLGINHIVITINFVAMLNENA